MKFYFGSQSFGVRCTKSQRPSLIVGTVLLGLFLSFQGCSLDVPYEMLRLRVSFWQQPMQICLWSILLGPC